MEFFWSLVTNNHPSKVGPGRMIPHRRSWDMLKISSSSSPLGFWYSLVHHRRAVLRLTLNHYHACTMVLSTSHPLQSVSFALTNCSTFASVVTRKVQSRGKQKLGTERKRKHTRIHRTARARVHMRCTTIIPKRQQATAANHTYNSWSIRLLDPGIQW